MAKKTISMCGGLTVAGFVSGPRARTVTRHPDVTL